MLSLKFFKRFSQAIPAIFILLTSCKVQTPSLYKKSRLAMDTLVSISIYADSEASAERSFEMAFDEIARLEKMLNFYSNDSEISEINRNAGIKPVTVSREVFEVIEKAVQASELTGGAFDISVGAATALWDFKNGIKPDETVLAAKTKLIGFKDIILDGEKSTVFLAKKGMLIDPGGIVKGYSADRAAEKLRKSGVVSGVVAVSGDIVVFGGKPDGSPWEIGIKQPVAGSYEKVPVAVLKLSDAGISTSGGYERYFVKEGRLYHHLLDPRTGLSSGQGMRSVTVVADECALSDALSTGIFVLGTERGLELMKRLGIKGVIVDENGNVFKTGF